VHGTPELILAHNLERWRYTALTGDGTTYCRSCEKVRQDFFERSVLDEEQNGIDVAKL
jgi:hypothetical protein